MRNEWTPEEVGYLERQAGRMTPAEIGRALGRSAESVRQKAKRMRVSLRLSRLGICPVCGSTRSTWALNARNKGVCRICEKRMQLQAIEARMAELIAAMPPKDRATYAATESIRESRQLPKPKPKRAVGKSQEQARKAREQHQIAMEAWEIGCLQRRIKAAQKRKERMEKKCRNNGNDTLPDERGVSS